MVGCSRPESVSTHEAERSNIESKQSASIGSATMKEDGTIVLQLRAEADNGAVGQGLTVVSPSDLDYEKTIAHLGGLKPGQEKSVPPWPDKKDSPSDWSETVNGLSIRLVAPPPAKSGQRVTVGIHFRNHSSDAMRIFLRPDAFRALQSTLWLPSTGDPSRSMQPPPRPHGYVVTEADFLELPAAQTLRLQQELMLHEEIVAGKTSLTIRWTYENDITRWKSGRATVDGLTKDVFGGGPIPGIWTGTLEATVLMTIVPK